MQMCFTALVRLKLQQFLGTTEWVRVICLYFRIPSDVESANCVFYSCLQKYRLAKYIPESLSDGELFFSKVIEGFCNHPCLSFVKLILERELYIYMNDVLTRSQGSTYRRLGL